MEEVVYSYIMEEREREKRHEKGDRFGEVQRRGNKNTIVTTPY